MEPIIPVIVKVQMSRCTPPENVSSYHNPDSYYAGAKDCSFLVASDEDPALENQLKSNAPFPQARHQFPNAACFVEQILQDPKAVVIRTGLISQTNDQNILIVHAIDLDANLSKDEKSQLREWLLHAPPPAATLDDLIRHFPGFKECFDQVQQLLIAAKNQGRQVICISTGFKGFRILITDPHPSLYIPTCPLTSTDAIKALVAPVVCTFFGLSEPPSCMDYSIWGRNKGVRTNLHPHPATGLWPNIILLQEEPQGPYGCQEPDSEVQCQIADFWKKCIQRAPAVERTDEDQPPAIETARKKRKKKQGQALDTEEEVQEEDEPSPVDDDFANVKDLLALRGWIAQPRSFVSATKGSRWATVIVDSAQSITEWTCPVAHRVHESNTFRVSVDRITGDLTVKCNDADCWQKDYPWPTLHSEGSLGDDALFRILIKGSLQSHDDIAQAINKSVKDIIAFDPESLARCKWRHYDADTGTWHACDSVNQPRTIIRDVLVQLITALVDRACRLRAQLPTGSKARKAAQQTEEFLSLCIPKTGSVPYMTSLCSAVEPRVIVDAAQWKSHFRAHLPVANALLHFSVETGAVTAIPYQPHLYVRHEYQAAVKWNGGVGEPHPQLESLLNSWWDKDERNSWLEFAAYALSRTAYAEKIFFLYGPPASAKSSFTGLKEHWFGPHNIFVQPSPSLIVQQNPKANQHDDDGKGHDSTKMSCYDKAIVVFPEPAAGSFLRDNHIKTMSGDRQGGRRAHSDKVENVERTFTMCVSCNYIPKPVNAQDDAMRGRIEILTCSRIFYRSEALKTEIEAKLSEESRKLYIMCKADPTVVERVKNDPTAGTAFLHLLAAAWTRLIVDQGRMFRPSPSAQKVSQAYWNALSDGDSVVTFLKDQVAVEAHSIVPKRTLWIAYQVWHKIQTQLNGSPGTLVTKDNMFGRLVNKHFEHPRLDTAQATVPVMKEDTPDFFQPGTIFVTPEPQAKVNCYKGIKLIACPDAYPSYYWQTDPATGKVIHP